MSGVARGFAAIIRAMVQGSARAAAGVGRGVTAIARGSPGYARVAASEVEAFDREIEMIAAQEGNLFSRTAANIGQGVARGAQYTAVSTSEIGARLAEGATDAEIMRDVGIEQLFQYYLKQNAAQVAAKAGTGLFLPVVAGSTVATIAGGATASVIFTPTTSWRRDVDDFSKKSRANSVMAIIDQIDAKDLENDRYVDSDTHRKLLVLRLARSQVRRELEKLRDSEQPIDFHDVAHWEGVLNQNLLDREQVYADWTDVQSELHQKARDQVLGALRQAELDAFVTEKVNEAVNTTLTRNPNYTAIEDATTFEQLDAAEEYLLYLKQNDFTSFAISKIDDADLQQYAQGHVEEAKASVQLALQKQLDMVEQRRDQLRHPQPPDPTPDAPPPTPPPPDPTEPIDAGRPQTNNTQLTHDAEPNPPTDSGSADVTTEAAESGGSKNDSIDLRPYLRKQRRQQRREQRNNQMTPVPEDDPVKQQTVVVPWYHEFDSKRPDPQPSWEIHGDRTDYAQYQIQSVYVSPWQQLVNFFFSLFRWPP